MDYPKSVAGVGLLAGKFTDGNPLTGTPASRDPAAWANAVTDEILAVVGAAGIVPDEANLAQLLAALRSAGVFQTSAQFDNTTKAATNAFVRNELLGLGNSAYNAIFGASKTTNGYQKLPSGLILQWGITGLINAATNIDITFPVAFPFALASLVTNYVSYSGDTAAQQICSQVRNNTLTTFTLRNLSATVNAQFYWYAIGY